MGRGRWHGPICCHTYRGGVEIGREILEGRRVAHPDFGGWLLLDVFPGTAPRPQGLFVVYLSSGLRKQGAVARGHLVTMPCSVLDLPPQAQRALQHCRTCRCGAAIVNGAIGGMQH